MIPSRVNGLHAIFLILLTAANIGLFVAWVAIEEWTSIFELQVRADLWAYTFGIAAAIVFSSSILRERFTRRNGARLFEATRISLRLFVAFTVCFLVLYFLMKDAATSRRFLSSFLFGTIPLNLILARFLPDALTHLFYRRGSSDRAIIVGDGAPTPALLEYIEHCNDFGIEFVGYLADEPIPELRLRHLGKARETEALSGLKIDRVLAYHHNYCNDTFRSLVDYCDGTGVRLQIYSRFANAFPERVRTFSHGDMVFFTMYDERLENPLNAIGKRLLDIAIALPVVAFVLPPLYLSVWVAQRMQSPGRVLFRQERLGRNRMPFTILKFRSMHDHQRAEDEARQASRDDPRVFPFGAFLRKTSLDEVPQFLNVLRGEMSVVGPRPHMISHDEQFEKLYRAYRTRHFVKPGITGVAQINGFRGETPDPDLILKRVHYDIEYIDNWSFSLDVYIILKTAWQVIFPPQTAY